jgi:cell wall-associated NlpC family hydrolase
MMTTLTTVGLGLATASPAAAAPDNNDIGAVQARVDRLSVKADAAERRHDKAAATLSDARAKLDGLSKGIHRQRRLMDSVQSQVANSTVGQYDATGGASAPAGKLSKDSKVLLTNVTSVSEDTGARGDQLARSSAKLEQLGQRRAAVRDQVTMLHGLEKSLRAQQAKVDTRAAKVNANLASLQAKAAAAKAKAAAAKEKAAAAKMAKVGGPVLAYAKSQVGKAYVFGAAGPGAFACSGLTMMAWKQAGVSLPHSSSAQYASGRHISESELQPGDLVFYYSPISHVGLYIGNGQIVNALNPGSGVRISGLHDMPYSGAVRPG